jgi:hypothetical protein
MITGAAQLRFGKRALLRLEFLQAHHVGSRIRQPRQQIRQPPVDVVDVESGDLQDARRRSP